MDTNGKASKKAEIGLTENKSGDVVVQISGEERNSIISNQHSSNENKCKAELDHSPHRVFAPMSYASSDIGAFAPSPNRPPRIPRAETLARRKSFSRSVYSKPKSRFGEQSSHIDPNVFDEMLSTNSPLRNVSSRAESPNNTPKATIRTVSITPRTPLMRSPGGVNEVDEDEEIYKKVSVRKKMKHKRVKIKVLVQWVAFLCILGCVIVSLTVEELKHSMIWGLEIWKWCVLVLVTFCGMLVTNWFMHFVVLLIELNYLLKKKVLYFVHGLKKCVQVVIWLNLVLATWLLLFNNDGVERSRFATRVLESVTWTIVSLLVGGFLWLLKTLLLKILAANFHVNTFFDRVQESIFHQYVVLTLSGPPLLEMGEMLGRTHSTESHLSFRSTKKGKEGKEKEVIDMNKLHQMKQEKVSAWTMKMLVDVISKSGLYTFSNELEESTYDNGGEQADKEITSEMEAIAAAYHIFRNVAQPGCK